MTNQRCSGVCQFWIEEDGRPGRICGKKCHRDQDHPEWLTCRCEKHAGRI